jgi:DNA-binding transcriptional ArsR family regulator
MGQEVRGKRKKNIAQLKSCMYICNQRVAQYFDKQMKGDIFQAIADPTRRAILVLIATQAMTPNALAEHFDTTRQAVSKHIKVLADCELLTQNKAGREIYYHFNPVKMKEIDHWLEQFKKHWEDRFSQLDQVLLNLNSNKNEN